MDIGNIQSLVDKSPVTFTASKCVLCEQPKCFTLSNGEIHQPCPDCEKKAIDKELNKVKDKTFFMSQIDNYCKKYTFADYKLIKFKDPGMIVNQKKMLEKIHLYLDNFELGKWLVMFGRQGTGKGMIKNLMLKDLGSKGISFINTDAKTIYNEWLKANSNLATESVLDMTKRLTSTDVLVIDELGRHKITESMKDFLFDITNMIYKNNKSLILITNLTVDKISTYIDKDRLGENTQWIPFYWESYRPTK